ncbi:ribonuclease HII [Candidatus Woesearchaeota archaeon]|nr:ribonuclease HII [Candidatus Woesearchaeota archaeon]
MVLTCGIDEAGRGPILGPMVMAGVVLDEQAAGELKLLGVKDSKLLTISRMRELYGKITGLSARHMITVIPAEEIDSALESSTLNLNWLEAQKTAHIISQLKPDKAIIDSPSVNLASYKSYLARLLQDSRTELIVEHKADLNHVECGAASILAKVTRENEIEKIKNQIGNNFGSGYLTDPLTKAFLDDNFDKHPAVFRKSWIPYKRAAETKAQRTLEAFTEVSKNGK